MDALTSIVAGTSPTGTAEADLVAGLRRRGLTLTYSAGRVTVVPGSGLTDEDADRLAAAREPVTELLRDEAWATFRRLDRWRAAWAVPDAIGEPSIPAGDLAPCPECRTLMFAWQADGSPYCPDCEGDPTGAVALHRRLCRLREELLARLRAVPPRRPAGPPPVEG